MANEARQRFIQQLGVRFPSLRKLPKTRSLYDIGDGAARLYVRYSKRHSADRTFYGLRAQDLRQLEDSPSFICFLWDGQEDPLLVPYAEFEEVFHSTPPAADGQFKTQIYLEPDATEMYIARAGRFNVESYFGWDGLEHAADRSEQERVPELTHPQVQTLLGAIGSAKGYDVWIPPSDRGELDWSLVDRFNCRRTQPSGYGDAANILREVDVVWISRGSNDLRALFEVEHSTPIYSGLLRFNDVRLAAPRLQPRFSIVANDSRRSLFVRQLSRPTFRASGLSEICSFLEYANVFGWYQRLARAS